MGIGNYCGCVVDKILHFVVESEACVVQMGSLYLVSSEQLSFYMYLEREREREGRDKGQGMELSYI